jgi:uncharacterized phage protein gp47/JayE
MSIITLKSENQILSDMIATIFSQTGLTDINPGSVLLTLLEAAARQDFAQYYQLMQAVKNYNLDTTTGTDLDNRAFEYGLTRTQAQQATGQVNILRPAGFVKISSGFFAGFRAPLAGDTVIYVNDASEFGSSGTLIIGRGTPVEEEVNFSSAPVNNTNYWTVTLSSSVTNNHNTSEVVILSQGFNITINAGTFVQVPATSKNPAVVFQTTQEVTILAGEAEVDGVDVRAIQAGAAGNIPVNAIPGTTDAFPTPPFTGAQAVNVAAFTTGSDMETDTQLRNRIKQFIQGLSQSTASGIFNAILGLTDAETSKRVVSANIVEPTNPTDNVKVYIDDGTGFEPSFSLQGQETILASAQGLETRLQLMNFPLVKAFVQTINATPYNFTTNGLTLEIAVGNSSETIVFNNLNFLIPEAASADEIVNEINSQSTLVDARTADIGTTVFISAKVSTNEGIQILGGTANAILDFPIDLRETFYLYKNDRLLSKDGATAYVDSASTTFNFSSVPETLAIIVDGKSANPQTVTFQLANFSIPSQATPEEVVAVINAQLAGATASVFNNNTVRLTSNTTLSSASKIQINSSAAATTLGFPLMLVTGANDDYVLNEQLGTIGFNSPLSAGDMITAGTRNTRGFLTATNPQNYTVGASTTLLISVDGGSVQTITLPARSAASASLIAGDINAQLLGGLAVTRTIGNNVYLEIRTNSYNATYGSIEITGGTAVSVFGFPVNSINDSIPAHVAFVENSSLGPWSFDSGWTLVVIIDNDPIGKTFVIPIDYAGQVTSGSSTTIFAASVFSTVFLVNNILNNFYVVFRSGANTTTQTISQVDSVGGNTYKYTFSALPPNFTNFAVGDEVTFSSMKNADNNGSFLITAINSGSSPYWVEITNAVGKVESASTGTGLIGQRRQVSAYTTSTGQITVSSAFSHTPSASDNFAVIPSTSTNLLNFLNNFKVTSISALATIEAVNQNRYLQISSDNNGSDGYIQVAGGKVNNLVQFSTTEVQGHQAYSYYTGLTKLVHKTIYGDETDLSSFPGVGAAGVSFEVAAPSTVEAEFSIQVSLAQGLSLATLENEIQSQIISYVNTLGVGDSVILSNIVERVLNGVSGINDIVITFPTSNIEVLQNEVAKTQASLINVEQIN